MNRRDAMKTMAVGAAAVLANPLGAAEKPQENYGVTFIFAEDKAHILVVTHFQPGIRVSQSGDGVEVTINRSSIYISQRDHDFSISQNDTVQVIAKRMNHQQLLAHLENSF